MDQKNKIITEPDIGIDEKQKEFLSALLSGNYARCSELVESLLYKGLSIKELYENVIKKALYDVGELWELNRISVATEHMASAIVESILNQLYPEIISKKKISKTILAACVEGEYHQIGVKMVSDIFEMNGWNTYFLGSNTPNSELINYMKTINPDLFAVSVSLYFNLPKLEILLPEVRNSFPNLTIITGGQAFRHGGEDIIKRYNNVFLLPDLESTELFIKNLK